MGTESPYNPKRSFLFHKPADFTLKMAPMIDIIFLLLIFFLVCAKWLPQEKLLPFSFPVAQAGHAPLVKPQPLLIHIKPVNNGCLIQIENFKNIEIRKNTTEQDLVNLLDELNNVITAQHRYLTDPVELTCEGKVKWDYFAKIYNVLYGIGMTDITIVMTEAAE